MLMWRWVIRLGRAVTFKVSHPSNYGLYLCLSILGASSFSPILLISTDPSALRRRRHSSRSRLGPVSSRMGEDKEGDDGMDGSDMSARIPPKKRKGWIRKTACRGQQGVFC